MKDTITIDPTRTYSVLELVKLNAFPGVKDYRSCLRRVMDDAAKGRNSVLKPQILGEGKSKRIYILGSNFIKYADEINSK